MESTSSGFLLIQAKWQDVCPHSRDVVRPSFAEVRASPPRKRARGGPGRRTGTHGPCAKECTRLDHRFNRDCPAFPAQWFEQLIPRSPRRRIPFATVASRGRGAAVPGRDDAPSQSLAPATGARTTRLCRTRSSFVATGFGAHVHARLKMLARRTVNVGRLARGLSAHGFRLIPKAPPCDSGAPDAAASTAFHPAFRDDRDPPL